MIEKRPEPSSLYGILADEVGTVSSKPWASLYLIIALTFLPSSAFTTRYSELLFLVLDIVLTPEDNLSWTAEESAPYFLIELVPLKKESGSPE